MKSQLLSYAFEPVQLTRHANDLGSRSNTDTSRTTSRLAVVRQILSAQQHVHTVSELPQPTLLESRTLKTPSGIIHHRLQPVMSAKKQECTMRGRHVLQLLVLTITTLAIATPGIADDDRTPANPDSGRSASTTSLEQTIAEQSRRIEQLESALQAVIGRLDQAGEDSNQAAPLSTTASEDGDDSVDREYVDERIEDFEDAPTNRFMVSGYGTTGLVNVNGGRTAFGIGFTPSFHFRLTDRLHFNSEIEIELEVDDERETEFEFGLEYAQIDYLAADWLAISAGQFLTPYNTFGPRLHPTWINKLSSAPPIYGGHAGGGFIPILKTLGVMGSGGTALWSDDSKINYAFYVGNGSTEHELSDPPTKDELLDIEFDNTPDLDDGVMVGGRMGFLPIANLEVGASYMTDNPSDVRYHLAGLDASYYYEGLELRGEYSYLTRDAGSIDADVHGYWIQAAYRLNRLLPDRNGWRGFANRLEPVVRWGQVLDFEEKNRDQLAIGLNYWLFESAPLKLTYEFNDGSIKDNRLLVNFAYGF